MKPAITTFDNVKHREQVIALWQQVFGYEAAHNAPALVIDKKLAFGDGLFFVALDVEAEAEAADAASAVIGTVMAGYDGHRGWIYAIAVAPDYQKQGIGSALLAYAERALSDLGCMKINLQIMEGNEAVESFYVANGYRTEKRISMGKRIPENVHSSQ